MTKTATEPKVGEDMGLGRCRNHSGRFAVVGLQGVRVCMDCFTAGLKEIKRVVSGRVQNIGDDHG